MLLRQKCFVIEIVLNSRVEVISLSGGDIEIGRKEELWCKCEKKIIIFCPRNAYSREILQHKIVLLSIWISKKRICILDVCSLNVEQSFLQNAVGEKKKWSRWRHWNAKKKQFTKRPIYKNNTKFPINQAIKTCFNKLVFLNQI